MKTSSAAKTTPVDLATKLGDQFNWQTPKSYAGTCRVTYVEFGSTHASPTAQFTLRR